jgi:hypothetical protein
MSHLRYFSRIVLLAFLAFAVYLPLHFQSRVPGGDYESRANVVRRFLAQVPGGGGDRDRPSPVRHQRVPSRRYLSGSVLLVAPALALFLVVYLLGLLAGDSSGAAGPVRIENVRINHLPQASSPRIEVDVELKNHDQVAHDIQAWWLLARTGASRPWDVYAFRSSSQGPRALAAGERVKLSWSEEVAAEPGTYELSVWVHTVEIDGTRHSDGTRVDNPIVRIDSRWSPLTRRATPPPDLQVSAVDLAAAASDGGLRLPTELGLIISIRNETAVDTEADLQWFLYQKASRLPWNAKPAYTARPLQHKVFAANRETTITASDSISLWPGEYLLRVVVTETGGEDSSSSDDLFLTDAIEVVENNNASGIIRGDAAPGPVEIEKLRVDIGSFQLGKGSVTVSLRNRSDSEQDVVLWWFLARPGSLEPWVESDVQSKVFTYEIAAERESILDLSDKASAPPGTYELSVWVHTLDSEGEEIPNDGVWFNRPVEIHS